MSPRLVRFALSLFAVAVVAFFAAGCGASGGNDAEPTTTEAPSDDEPAEVASDDEEAFVDQANAICSEGNDALADLGETLDENSSQEELEVFVDDFTANIGAQLDAIEALDVPDSLASEVEAFIETARTALDGVAEQGAAVVTNEDDPFVETNEMALDLGLTECGSE